MRYLCIVYFRLVVGFCVACLGVLWCFGCCIRCCLWACLLLLLRVLGFSISVMLFADCVIWLVLWVGCVVGGYCLMFAVAFWLAVLGALCCFAGVDCCCSFCLCVGVAVILLGCFGGYRWLIGFGFLLLVFCFGFVQLLASCLLLICLFVLVCVCFCACVVF